MSIKIFHLWINPNLRSPLLDVCTRRKIFMIAEPMLKQQSVPRTLMACLQSRFTKASHGLFSSTVSSAAFSALATRSALRSHKYKPFQLDAHQHSLHSQVPSTMSPVPLIPNGKYAIRNGPFVAGLTNGMRFGIIVAEEDVGPKSSVRDCSL